MLVDEQKNILGTIVYPAESLRQRFQRNKPKVVRNVPKEHKTCTTSDLEKLIEAGQKSGAIYADPPLSTTFISDDTGSPRRIRCASIAN